MITLTRRKGEKNSHPGRRSCRRKHRSVGTLKRNIVLLRLERKAMPDHARPAGNFKGFCICHKHAEKLMRGFSKRDLRLDFHLGNIKLVICSMGNEREGGQSGDQLTTAVVQAEDKEIRCSRQRRGRR